MSRSYYSNSISNFLKANSDEIFGILVHASEFADMIEQKDSWAEEIKILKEVLKPYEGSIFFEYSIPRMGLRIDIVLLIGPVIFVLEFKINESVYHANAIDQVWDYALDLKNFHETSHEQYIAPVLIATQAKNTLPIASWTASDDHVLLPIKCNTTQIIEVINKVLQLTEGDPINKDAWENGRYSPTPTIVEAALALYKNHNVKDISRSDAKAEELNKTINSISDIILYSKVNSRKSICFVTGVPGAGKTLVGLRIATKHYDRSNELYSVYLSGNGPLVRILCEALARDKVQLERSRGNKQTKKQILSEVKAFIQNVHHFRDECLHDEGPPIEHVALFDEAQRAWNVEQTSNFMRRKKNKPNFNISEPEFLISCLDRHSDWAMVVCLVGGGQEINVGEAGISEWIESLSRSFQNWDIYISPRLIDDEYGSGEILKKLRDWPRLVYNNDLHLAVSIRSFRTEYVSFLVKLILDLSINDARATLEKIKEKYPIVITRNICKAKAWLKSKARGSERYGIVVSSQAERLKPLAIDVKSPMDPINWFLEGKDDVRSSYYLEDVATEFDVQGLELDWVCVTWDADFRYTPNGWEHWSFKGKKWQHINKDERKVYLKNAYRVLLTRARQGMVIVVPPGDIEDQTRPPKFYDATFEYLKGIGFTVI